MHGTGYALKNKVNADAQGVIFLWDDNNWATPLTLGRFSNSQLQHCVDSLPSGVPPASQEHDMATVGKVSGQEGESDVVLGLFAQASDETTKGTDPGGGAAQLDLILAGCAGSTVLSSGFSSSSSTSRIGSDDSGLLGGSFHSFSRLTW